MRIFFIALIFVGYFLPCGFAESFSDNGEWGKIKSAAYEITLYKNGQYTIDIKKLIRFKMSFIQRWKIIQSFPEVKLLNATLLKNKKDNSISVTFDYFWNKGEIKEQLIFPADSISASYLYIPSQKKNISMFTCLFKITAPMNPKTLELAGMQRHDELDGALLEIGKWKKIKAGLKMLSIRGTGDYVVNLIANDRAWLNIWSWPRIGMVNNGNYPKWDKTTYKNGEEYKMKYLISIVKKNGKTATNSPIALIAANKE